jgi:hypothetical protein
MGTRHAPLVDGMTHHPHDDPPTLAARGAPRPESRPGDDGPGAPARRRRPGIMALALLLILGGLSLSLMIAPAGLLVMALGLLVGVWGAVSGETPAAVPRPRAR